jgi:diadenosine tetraphosphate (Ap4A) HIT family hydrolase
MANGSAAPTWMPRSTWQSLVDGENCPMCDSAAGHKDPDHHGYLVADLRASRVRLSLDQFAKGYCVLIAHRHVREPYEFDPDERVAFFEDMCQVGRAIEDEFGAIKMNFQILGMKTPHVHAHAIPRYYGDPAPGRALLATDGRLELAEPEYLAIADQLRIRLATP